jgi:uncharacterized RDD family membrane protein YckC
VDCLILNLIGRGLGTALFNAISQLGGWGYLLGFCISAGYFATLESSIGSGQSVGKRLMSLRVVSAQGTSLTFGKSLLRFAVFSTPHFLNGLLWLPVTRTPPTLPLIVLFFALGVSGSTLYLLIFNRQTRQGLHDVVVAGYVVNSRAIGVVNAPPIWDTHWMVLRWYLSLLFLFGASSVFIENNLNKLGPVIQTREDVRLIENMDRVQLARVKSVKPLKWNAFMKSNPLATKHALIINVWWTGETAADEAFADQVASQILKSDPNVQKQDQFWVVISRGYYLGIASRGYSKTFAHTPAEWRQRLLATTREMRTTPPG